MNLKQALAQLDPTDDEHWTSDGLPRLDAVSAMVGGNVTRKQVTEALPGFARGGTVAPAAPAVATEVVADTNTPEPSPVVDGDEPPVVQPEVEPVAEPVSVMKMPMVQVLKSPELVERALHDIEVQCGVLHKQRKNVDAELKKLYAHSQALSMHLQRMQKSDPNAATNEVQRYLKQSQIAREKRAVAAQRFIGAGTSAKDVAAQLQTASKLDQVMARRKPGYGSQRPLAPQVAKTG